MGKLRLEWLLHHFPPRLIWSAYVFINGFISIGVLALLALVTRNPFVFPSLGPAGALMVLLDLSHPPAGATALIVSLGIIPSRLSS